MRRERETKGEQRGEGEETRERRSTHAKRHRTRRAKALNPSFPPYSRGGEETQQKATLFKPKHQRARAAHPQKHMRFVDLFTCEFTFFKKPKARRQRRPSPSREDPQCIVFPSHHRGVCEISEKSMIFEPPAPARRRGAPSETHTFQWFRRAPTPPRGAPRRKKSHPPGRTGAYAFSSMADHANPLEGVTFPRSELAQPPTQNHNADPLFANS